MIIILLEIANNVLYLKKELINLNRKYQSY